MVKIDISQFRNGEWEIVKESIKANAPHINILINKKYIDLTHKEINDIILYIDRNEFESDEDEIIRKFSKMQLETRSKSK